MKVTARRVVTFELELSYEDLTLIVTSLYKTSNLSAQELADDLQVVLGANAE